VSQAAAAAAAKGIPKQRENRISSFQMDIAAMLQKMQLFSDDTT
jgi:hypothetical protein